ncbi:hypothetical protein BD560DRAFT_369615 [Blakeslea trispora]|nr:hypothetical protein BD560DRAFT_369615 [Blakeslea trispora]
MPNDITQQEVSHPPPPYSNKDDILSEKLPFDSQMKSDKPNLSCTALKSLASMIDHCQNTPYECSCVLEDRFLLLGHSEGLQVLDLQQPNQPKTIIWTKVRQIVVIESCRVVLILGGRYRQVRCYSYDALLRLVYAVLSLAWDTRPDKAHDIPTHQAWELVASLTGKAPEEKPDEDNACVTASPQSISTATTNAQGYCLNLKERLVKKKEEKMPSRQISTVDHLILSGIAKLFYVCNDIILQDFYFKLPESKDALNIETYQTSSYIFVAVLYRDKIVLWQRKRDYPLRPFYRLKEFWIPTEARQITFADDRSTLRHLLVVFSHEATAIELRDGKVQTVRLDSTLERIYQTTWVRDKYEHQLESPIHIPPTLPASLTAPPIQWTSILQLPFYPDTLPANTLTTDYSIPPSYQTVITSMASGEPPDPVALPSTVAPQLFFATFGQQSYIIDLTGALFSTQVYRWSESPDHIEFIQLGSDWHVVGFGSETVEVLEIKTARSVQRVMRGVPVKFLGRWDLFFFKRVLFVARIQN